MDNADLQALKLHVDTNGMVWVLQGDGPPQNTGQDVPAFLATDFKTHPHIRLIGRQRNASLIRGLFQWRASKDIGSFEICSPLVCQTEQQRSDPVQSLLAMRQFRRTSSTGGWHLFRTLDYTTYAIAEQLQKKRNETQLRKLVHAHIVWPALSFVPCIKERNVALLVNEILDPRWFIDLTHVARGSKLRAYMGLDLRTMRGFTGEGPVQHLQHRCKMVLDTWYVSSGDNIDEPSYFLQRILRKWRDKGDSTRGLLRASQTFLEFMRLSWLAGLNAGAKQSEALFVPEYFFKSDAEIDAFKEHIRRIRS